MADSPILPGSHLWRLNRQGQLPEDFWRFFRDLVTFVQQTQGNTTDLAAVEARLAALEQSGLSADILGNMSVQVLGSLEDGQVVLRLRGDSANPGPLFHYATDASGNKGWQENLLSALSDVDLSEAPLEGEVLKFDAVEGKWKPGAATGSTRGIHITGGSMSGPTIAVGSEVGALSPSDYTLTGNWLMWCYPSGSVQVDVRRSAFGALPPDAGDSICGGSFPEISAGTSATGTFTGWSTSISQGDAMTVVVNSSTVSWFVLLLEAA